MGIVFSNFIRNAGNMPKIQATTDYNSITGQLNSIALDTSSNTLYYWDPTVPEWIGLNGGGAPNLQNVLNTGNTASNIALVIQNENIVVGQGSFLAADVTLDGRIVTNAVGIEWSDLLNTITKWQIYQDGTTGDVYQKVLCYSAGGTTILQPSTIATDINVIYPNTSGQLYNLVFAVVTLVNGVGTYVNTGGSNNIVIGVIITNTNGSNPIAHGYKYNAVGNLITVTALKQNGGTETSDQSTLTVTIAK